MLYGYCTPQGCFVTTSTGTTRAASAAESALLQGMAGTSGYLDTVDTPTPPPPAAPAPTPVSPVLNPNPAGGGGTGGTGGTGTGNALGGGGTGGTGGTVTGNPLAPAPAPVSYDPVGGPNTPTFTPGIVFGQGVLPGQGRAGNALAGVPGQPYQRQWFDVGGDPAKEELNQAFYNDPNNFNLAWDKALGALGIMPGSSYGNFFSNFAPKAKNDFNNMAPYGGDKINVADFIDAYAPQVKGVYDLLSPQARGVGGRLFTAGRATY